MTDASKEKLDAIALFVASVIAEPGDNRAHYAAALSAAEGLLRLLQQATAAEEDLRALFKMIGGRP